MRKTIIALLLGATAATPVLAQPAGPGELRRDRQEIRRDRAEVREQRQDYRQNLRQGDFAEARRDRAELQRDRAELRESRQELRSDRRGDQPGWADRRDDRRDWRQDRRDDIRDRRDDRQDWRRDNRWAGNNNGWNGPGRGDPRLNDGRWNDGRGWNDPRFNNGANRGWDNRWRNDRRYDWQRYRSANRGFYTLPRYYGPQGFGGYRQWGIGGRIGQPFYARNYWIADPWAYRLPPAYGNYRWVRYYDDVLLVDVYTGIVRDALYGFFF